MENISIFNSICYIIQKYSYCVIVDIIQILCDLNSLYSIKISTMANIEEVFVNNHDDDNQSESVEQNELLPVLPEETGKSNPLSLLDNSNFVSKTFKCKSIKSFLLVSVTQIITFKCKFNKQVKCQAYIMQYIDFCINEWEQHDFFNYSRFFNYSV